jgi:hypothetical protein
VGWEGEAAPCAYAPCAKRVGNDAEGVFDVRPSGSFGKLHQHDTDRSLAISIAC